MGQTSAERQAAYRARNARAGVDPDVIDRPLTARVNTVIDYTAYTALTRLAAFHGLTKRAMLEQLLTAAQHEVVSDQANTQRYYSVTP